VHLLCRVVSQIPLQRQVGSFPVYGKTCVMDSAVNHSWPLLCSLSTRRPSSCHCLSLSHTHGDQTHAQHTRASQAQQLLLAEPGVSKQVELTRWPGWLVTDDVQCEVTHVCNSRSTLD